jgi:UDP-glucose 4-epimerase
MNTNLRGSTILVTGSEGFLGRPLVSRLRSLGAGVIPYDLKIGKDVLDRPALEAAVRTVDGVIYLAGPSSSLHFLEDEHRSWMVAYHGLENTLRMLRGRIVYASTATIYGASQTPVSETAALPLPPNRYAASKLLGEHLCLRYLENGADPRIVRIFSGYGVGEERKGDYASIVARCATAANTSKPLPDLYGDGSQVRDFVFVDDVVEGLILALRTTSPRRIFNIGTGRGTSFHRVLEVVGESFGTKLEPRHATAPTGYVASVVADITVAQRELGYTPSVDVVEGIRRAIASIRGTQAKQAAVG